MKKIISLSLLLVFIYTFPVQALSWAYPFVVWKGNVYEVKQDELIDENTIGKMIGEVKTQPDDMTGNYYGNASNYYPKETKYYEIKDVSTSDTIAIKEDTHWVAAVYVDQAPFHIMNIISNFYFIFGTILAVLILTIVLLRYKKGSV